MKKASDIINELFSGKVLSQINKYNSLFTSWENIVGKRLSSHSKVKNILNSIIIIEVDHPGWCQVIQIEQANILRKIKLAYPTLQINGIAIKLKT